MTDMEKLTQEIQELRQELVRLSRGLAWMSGYFHQGYEGEEFPRKSVPKPSPKNEDAGVGRGYYS